jgi:hypothetical protein
MAFVAADRQLSIAIIAGVVAGIAVIGLMEATARFIPLDSHWQFTLDTVLSSLSPLIPGLVAGYLSSRSAFVVGAVASALTSILWSAYGSWIETGLIKERSATPAIPDELTFAVIALIVGGICGIAGAAIPRRKQNAF